jgi:hypothetical protein
MKTNKRKIATILLVVVFFSFFPSLNFNVYGATTYTGQTEVGDYSISNMSQLVLLSEKVNSGTSYEGSTFTLLSDLYHYDALPRGEYIPIGNLENPFSGVFDGNGFKIRSLNMELASAEESYYTGKENNFGGIFGNIENAIIKNLTADYNTLYVKEGPPKYIGAIAGKATSSLIDNCHATGRFEKSQNDNTTVVGAGGLVGVAVNTRINNSTNSGFYRLRSWIWYDNHYSGPTGGIVGKIEKNSSISIPSFVGEVGVFNCTNNSRTDSRSEEYHYDNRTSVEVSLGSGGIAYSVVNAKIENCVNNSPFIDAGIVYSASSSEINFSINNGYSSQGRYDSDDRDYSSYGRNRAGIAYSMNNSTMLGCINYGEVSTNTRFANRVQRRTVIAGLVYSATDSLIKKSANYGLISINAYSRYSTVGGAEAGGIVGYANNTTIDTCYNTGDVLVYYDGNLSSHFELYYSSYDHVGGIVSKESGSTVKNTYSSGDVRNTTYYDDGDRIYKIPYGISGTSLPISDTYFLQGSLKYTYRTETNERPYPGGSISLDKSSTFMQSSSFLTLINNNTPDNPYIQQSGINNGYPIFKFLKQLVTVKINGGSEVGINSSLQLTAESNPSDSYELEGIKQPKYSNRRYNRKSNRN